MLDGKPYFKEIFPKFLSWIDDAVKISSALHNIAYFPGELFSVIDINDNHLEFDI